MEVLSPLSKKIFFKVAKRELRDEYEVPKRSLGTSVQGWRLGTRKMVGGAHPTAFASETAVHMEVLSPLSKKIFFKVAKRERR